MPSSAPQGQTDQPLVSECGPPRGTRDSSGLLCDPHSGRRTSRDGGATSRTPGSPRAPWTASPPPTGTSSRPPTRTSSP
eukprot:11064242-Alexandrium_andersonii.AAC.1